jgi:hypothetical protein
MILLYCRIFLQKLLSFPVITFIHIQISMASTTNTHGLSVIIHSFLLLAALFRGMHMLYEYYVERCPFSEGSLIIAT